MDIAARVEAARQAWNDGDLDGYLDRGDRVVERWPTADSLGMLTEIGALPAPA